MDVSRNGERATASQLELLATVKDIDIDDLLDQNLSQGEVITQLRLALHGDQVPVDVRNARRVWRERNQVSPECRICGKKDSSTKHHFVNKWILKELRDYQRLWADRTVNCIPACVDCHRDLHARVTYERDKSIYNVLTASEKQFAQKAIQAFINQHPRIAWIVVQGDDAVYEARLFKDFVAGHFNI